MLPHFSCSRQLPEVMRRVMCLPSGPSRCLCCLVSLCMLRGHSSESQSRTALGFQTETVPKFGSMKGRPIIPSYQMIAIAVVILAGIVVVMLQQGTWLHLIDEPCDRAHD